MKLILLLLTAGSVVWGMGQDGDERCCFWAMIGECDGTEESRRFMQPVCQKSCGTQHCSVRAAEAGLCQVRVNIQGCRWANLPMSSLLQAKRTRSGNQKSRRPQPQRTPPRSGWKQPRWGLDNDERCCFWAQLGLCDTNIQFMRPQCQQSCGSVGCMDHRTADRCPSKPDARGCPWQVRVGVKTTKTGDNFKISRQGGREFIPLPGDEHPDCCYWAMTGQCDKNPGYVKRKCMNSCGTLNCRHRNKKWCPTKINLKGCPWALRRKQ